MNTELRSPQTARRQAVMLVSVIFFPVLCDRNFSRNCRIDVWSNTCEHTAPPRLQGEAITSGTRNPRPMELSRLSLAGLCFNSCVIVTYSAVASMPGDILPVLSLVGCGGTKGGT